MNKTFIFLQLLLFNILTSCGIFFQSPLIDGGPYIVREFNPQKAGADIAARIALPSYAYYVTCLSEKCYSLYDNSIGIYDLTNDDLIFINKLSFNLNQIYNDQSEDYKYTISQCRGLLVYKEKVTAIINIKKTHTKKSNDISYLWEALSVSLIQPNNCWNDTDNFTIQKLDFGQTYWYDCSEDILFVGNYREYRVNNATNITKYYYDKEEKSFELLNKIEFVYNNNYYEDCENGLFLVNDYFLYRACYFEYPTDNSNSYLSIYSNYELQNVKTIHLDYLQFRSVTSAFSDSKGDIWLYVCQNSKYELLKLKLLE